MKVFLFLIVCVLFCSLTKSKQDENQQDSNSNVIQPMRDEGHKKRETSVNRNKKAHRCDLPLGMEDGRIADHQITASSNSTWRGVASRGRLGIKASNGYYGAWVSSHYSWGWLQIDLGDVTMVTKVATQGRQDTDQWVTRYYLQYSIDGIHWVYYKNKYSNEETFSGNSDRNTVVTNTLKPSIYARYVRFATRSVLGHAAMRVEVYGCRNVQSCSIPLGMEDGRIPNTALNASYPGSSPTSGRLNYFFGWCTSLKGGQYLQVDLSEVKTVTKVATQGYGRIGSSWVTHYYLQYSVDGMHWTYYTKPNTQTMNFQGNSYQHGIHANTLKHSIVARYVRFWPRACHGWCCMRVELYGCQRDKCLVPLGVQDGRVQLTEMTASSYNSSSSRPQYARVNINRGWHPSTNNYRQWLQVDLRTIKKITAVATQGYAYNDYWVTKYKIRYMIRPTIWVYEMNSVKENGAEKIFPGNNDRYTLVRNNIHPAIYARYVRFQPMGWWNGIIMRVEIYGCHGDQECSIPIGMEDGRVNPGAITASSIDYNWCTTNQSRLNSEAAWCPNATANQWLQIELPYLTMITKIATQGHQTADYWTTSYRLLYSMDGKHWDRHRHPDGHIRVFSGNSDRYSIVIHKLHNPIEARYVRFVPMTWHDHAALRVEVYGCHARRYCRSPLGMEDGRIRYSDLKSSSYLDANHDPRFSRLNSQGQYAWCASSNDSNHWLQIDLRITKTVTKIALQGVPLGQVKSYTLAYGITQDHWIQYKQYGRVKTFLGNYDAEAVVYQEINPAIHARFIRIQPSSWRGRICLRIELYGCLVEGIDE